MTETRLCTSILTAIALNKIENRANHTSFVCILWNKWCANRMLTGVLWEIYYLGRWIDIKRVLWNIRPVGHESNVAHPQPERCGLATSSPQCAKTMWLGTSSPQCAANLITNWVECNQLTVWIIVTDKQRVWTKKRTTFFRKSSGETCCKWWVLCFFMCRLQHLLSPWPKLVQNEAPPSWNGQLIAIARHWSPSALSVPVAHLFAYFQKTRSW